MSCFLHCIRDLPSFLIKIEPAQIIADSVVIADTYFVPFGYKLRTISSPTFFERVLQGVSEIGLLASPWPERIVFPFPRAV